MTLVARKIKARSWIDLPVFANHGLQIEIAAMVVRQTRVESLMPARALPRGFHMHSGKISNMAEPQLSLRSAEARDSLEELRGSLL